MSAESARSSRFSSCAALRSCSSSRSAAFSSNSSESRTCAIERAWSLSVLAPSSFQNRLLTRPEVRVFVFATHLRYAARQLPRPLWFVVGLAQLLRAHRIEHVAIAGRLSARRRRAVAERSRCALNRRPARSRCAGRWRWTSGWPDRRRARRRRAAAVCQICGRGGDGGAVAVATPVQRREDRPDPRYAGRGRAQHRHAHRCAVDIPEHEPVADGLRVVDEPLARRVVAVMAEGFVEEELHPVHELPAVASVASRELPVTAFGARNVPKR